MYAVVLLLALFITSARGVEDWRPVGQGDPLRDPTHVYSPPQVQHVHYWLKSPSFALEPPPSRAIGLGQVAGWPQVTAHYLGQNIDHQTTTTPVSITTAYPELLPFRIIKSPYSSPFVEKNSVHGGSSVIDNVQLFVNPNVIDPPPPFFPTSSSSRPLTFFTSPPPKKPLVFPSRNTIPPQKMPFTTSSPPLTVRPLTISTTPTTFATDNFAPIYENRLSESSSSPLVAKYIVYDTTTAAPTVPTTVASLPPISFVIEGHSKVKKYGPLPESTTSIHRVTHNHLLTNLIAKDEVNDADKYNPFRL